MCMCVEKEKNKKEKEREKEREPLFILMDICVALVRGCYK